MSTATCSRCLAEKPFDAFHKSKSNPNGIHKWCKSCRKVHDYLKVPIEFDRRLAPVVAELDKRCRTCQEWKTPDEFALLRSKTIGRRSECLECGHQRTLFKQNHPIQPKISYPAGYGQGSRVLGIYHGMKARCYCSTEPAYKNYGARGITVCQQWLGDYVSFLTWALSNGYADDLTIERINNDGPYSPENCRWATRFEQGQNKRNSNLVTAWDETKTASEWARDPRCVITRKALHYRLKKGVAPERAIAEPAHVGMDIVASRCCDDAGSEIAHDRNPRPRPC